VDARIKKFLQVHPEAADELSQVAAVRLSTGNDAGALELAETIVRLSPQNQKAHLVLKSISSNLKRNKSDFAAASYESR
jgi:Tfp pilus assembly protein PilF